MTTPVNDETRIMKANELVHACYFLTLREHQLLAFALATIPAKHPTTEYLEVIINLDAFRRFFDLNEKEIRISDLMRAADRLYERSIEVHDEANDISKSCRWLHFLEKDKPKRRIKLQFTPTVSQHLTGLIEYTSYSIGVIKQFSSCYTLPIYEMLARCRNMKKDILCLTYPELRKKLAIGNKYTRDADFKKCVINPVLADLDNNTKLSITYDLVKENNIYHLIIMIKDDIPKKRTYITKAMIADAAQPGESLDQVKARLKNQNPKPGESWEQLSKRLKEKLNK